MLSGYCKQCCGARTSGREPQAFLLGLVCCLVLFFRVRSKGAEGCGGGAVGRWLWGTRLKTMISLIHTLACLGTMTNIMMKLHHNCHSTHIFTLIVRAKHSFPFVSVIVRIYSSSAKGEDRQRCAAIAQHTSSLSPSLPLSLSLPPSLPPTPPPPPPLGAGAGAGPGLHLPYYSTSPATPYVTDNLAFQHH